MTAAGRSLVAALAGPLLLVAGPVRAAGDLEEAMALLDRLEGERVTVDWLDEPLAVVLDDLAEKARVPVRGDWDGLRQVGVRPRDNVTLRLERGPVTTVLAGLVLVIGDELARPVWEIHAGQVVVTSLESTARMRLTDVYDVRDLLHDGQTLERLRRPADPPSPPGAGAGDEEGGPPTIDWSPGEELLHLIIDHVDPEAWIDFGGSRGKITERDGVLLVTAAPTTHRMLRDALRRLREVDPTTLHLEVAIVETDEADLRRLERAHDPGTRDLARALLRDERSRVCWRTAASVSVGSSWESRTEAEAIEVELALRPTTDPTTGQIALAVEARAGHEGSVRQVVTTVQLPARRGAAVIELAAPEPTATRRLLVVLPKG